MFWRTSFSIVGPALLALNLATCGSSSPTPDKPGPLDSAEPVVSVNVERDVNAELHKLYEDHFDAYLALHPELAQSIGDARFNHVFPNRITEENRQALRTLASSYREKVAALEPSSLDSSQRTRREFFLYLRTVDLEALDTPNHLLPINQFDSYANHFAQLGSGQGTHPFKTEKDYRDFLSQAQGFSAWVDTAIARMREGMQQNIVLPKVLIERTLPQLAAHFQVSPQKSLFYSPLENMPASLSNDDKKALTKDYLSAIEGTIQPAYKRLHDFMKGEYLPTGTTSVGLGALPGGKAWYQHWIRYHTTTQMSAEEIHELGQAEVKRILAEMDQVRTSVGFKKPLKAFLTHMSTSPTFLFKSKADLISAYSNMKTRIDAILPKFFRVMPKTPYEVRPVEAFREKSSAGASYHPGSADGSRPGIFYINTYNLKAQPRWGVETLSLHEAAPGHHFQISLQQEMQGVPRFQRFSDNTAYVEGWALYAESIGKEMGLFTDPYQYFGRLSDEMLRAMRLVVDTGLHAKGWTRAQAIQFMRENSALAKSDIEAEVERYMAVPGQALAYKIGQLTISDLRAKAEATMGELFDVRAFHTQVLVDGSLPMDILAKKIVAWSEQTANAD